MAGAPPPPPPPPPPPAPSTEDSGANGAGSEDTASALFAEINSLGEGGIRQGLKKATRGPVNEEKPSETKDVSNGMKKMDINSSTKKKSDEDKKSKRELVGKKWVVEYQKDNPECVISVNSMKETIYIFKCNKTTIQVKGKCNSISIDSCNKLDLVFEDALSQVEIVNCNSVRVQCTGNAPSINIDGCNGVTYYLTKEAVEKCMVITAKSAAINLIRPKPEDEEDIIENYIPEQFMTTFKNGDFVTEAVAHDD